MCSHKSSKAQEPAAPVSAPTPVATADVQKTNVDSNVQAKGKKKLTINPMGTGTGVNI